MVTTMIIAFRESFEMLLIIVPLLVYLAKIDRGDLKKYIYLGSGIGVLTSILTGVIIFNQAKSLQTTSQHVFQGCMMLFLSALILYSIILLRKQNKSLVIKADSDINVKITAASLFILSFLTIFRESLEITIFTLPFINEAAINIALGILVGAAASISIMYFVYKGTLKFSIETIFNALTVILILLGALMFGEGLSELMPNMGDSVEKLGELMYAVPTLYIFVKEMLKKYIKKL
ncbi:FTR1 family protein [Clostridium thailandense]|uniref:FTR1 family protein n=1 Tax=Clostridium thailandense TaxID=2794346 RepID=UPI0039897DD8